MATQRPLKEGSVRTYQEKVALGFPDILASEMDADLDTIYAAWNGGLPANSIGSTQLIDGSVGPSKLADLAVTTPKLADLAVTTGKLADGAVATAKLVDASVTWPKMGARQVFVDTVAYSRPATNYQFTVTETAFYGTPSVSVQANRPVVILVGAGGNIQATAPPMGSSVLAVLRLRVTNAAGALLSEETAPFALTGTGTFPWSANLLSVHVPSAAGAQIYAVTGFVTSVVGGSQCFVTGVEALVLPFA